MDMLEMITAILEATLPPILLIELILLRRSGHLNWPRIKEMLANTSSLLFLIPGALAGGYLLFTLWQAIAAVRPFSIPTNWFTIVILMIGADLIYYAEHRFAHEKRGPWDLYHSTHHSSESFDQTTSLRLSGFSSLITVGFYTPLVLAGFSVGMVLIATGTVVAYQSWLHTEVINKTPRWFEFIFATPSHHRGHHGSDQHYLDKNYGGILIIWDRIFGTFQPEINTPVYGLTTQIESSNPIDIQFSQLRLLWRDLKTDANWKTRLQRLWNRPGWEPIAVVGTLSS